MKIVVTARTCEGRRRDRRDDKTQRPKNLASSIFWAMWRSGTSSAERFCSRSCGQRAKPGSGQVKQNDHLHRPIDISTAASCQEARQFQGNRPTLGKLPRRRRAFVRVLVLCVLGKSRGPLKALNSAPGPNSSTPNFNLDKPQHQPKKCNATIGTKNIRLANHNLSPRPD